MYFLLPLLAVSLGMTTRHWEGWSRLLLLAVTITVSCVNACCPASWPENERWEQSTSPVKAWMFKQKCSCPPRTLCWVVCQCDLTDAYVWLWHSVCMEQNSAVRTVQELVICVKPKSSSSLTSTNNRAVLFLFVEHTLWLSSAHDGQFIMLFVSKFDWQMPDVFH